MYLLKPSGARLRRFLQKFTFHYVSIKTVSPVVLAIIILNLHSTMYLLKLRQVLSSCVLYLHLHSTMYLLKPVYICNLIIL